MGQIGPSPAIEGEFRDMGELRSRGGQRSPLQIPYRLPGTELPCRQGRSLRFHGRGPAKNRLCGLDLDYRWGDQSWMENRQHYNALDRPISIYELHLGSWMRVPEEGNRWMRYREVAPKLAD